MDLPEPAPPVTATRKARRVLLLLSDKFFYAFRFGETSFGIAGQRRRAQSEMGDLMTVYAA
jgi:hypothetical protein